MRRLPLELYGSRLLLELEVIQAQGIAPSAQQVQGPRPLALHATRTHPQINQSRFALGVRVIPPIAVASRQVGIDVEPGTVGGCHPELVFARFRRQNRPAPSDGELVGRDVRGRRVGPVVEADDRINPLKGRLVLLVHALRLEILRLKSPGSLGLTALGETTQQVGDRFAVAPLGEATELDPFGGISGARLGRVEGSVDEFGHHASIGLRGLFLAVVGHGPVDVPGQRRYGLFPVERFIVLAGDPLALGAVAAGAIFAINDVS